MKKLFEDLNIQKTIETEVSTIHLTAENIIITIDKPVPKTSNNIQPLLDAYITLADGKKKLFFVYPTAMPMLTSDARKKAIPIINRMLFWFCCDQSESPGKIGHVVHVESGRFKNAGKSILFRKESL